MMDVLTDDRVPVRAGRTRALARRAASVALAAACAATAPGTIGSALAQSYPTKPVRVVVPFPPGGAIDIIARHVTQKLADAFGVAFPVDNRGGAGGAIGTENIARAAPDGYSLLVSSTSPMAINPHINKVHYDPADGFSSIGMIGYTPEVLVVHPSLPVRNVKELIAMAKAQPGALSYASSGVGTIIHVTGELFAQRAGVRLLHVPYKGAAPAVVDTVAGNVTLLFGAYPSVAGQMRAGKLKPLGITSLTRLSVAPELPTLAEAALPGFESNQWWALSGPAGMSAAVISRLNAELERALRTDDIRKRFAADGAEPAPGTPTQLTAYIKSEYEKWGAVVASAGIKGE